MLHAYLHFGPVGQFFLQFGLTGLIFYVGQVFVWSRRSRLSCAQLAALKPRDMRLWPHWLLVLYSAGFGLAMASSAVLAKAMGVIDQAPGFGWRWHLLGTAIPILVFLLTFHCVLAWVLPRSRRKV